MSLDSLGSDIVSLICAHVPLRERQRVCFALSKTFRAEAQRLGGKLALTNINVVPLASKPVWLASADETLHCKFGTRGRLHGRWNPSLRPTEIFFTGFTADAGELPATLRRHQASVINLHLELCKGDAISWLNALAGLRPTCISLEWNNPAVPIQVAMTIVASMRALQTLQFHVRMMPQVHPPTGEQCRNALLPVGLLAAIPTLRDVTLMEGPRDGEGVSDQQLFGYTAPYRPTELDCDPDIISGLCLGLSALQQVTMIESDLLGDWGLQAGAWATFADAWQLMLHRLPGLQDLGTVFFVKAATWQQLHNSQLRHPSLECLRLRYCEPTRADLEVMAQSICEVFPRLRELSLELDNNFEEGLSQAEDAARLLNGLREHPRLQRLCINWDDRSNPARPHIELQEVFEGLAAHVELVVDRPLSPLL